MTVPLTALPALPPTGASTPRCVAQLAFPEILVIWALRRCTDGRPPRVQCPAAVATEFSRAFGLARLEEVLAAVTGLAESLARAARLPQALSALEDDRIGASEEALLATLAALQRGETAQAAALAEWILLPAARPAFLDAAGILARALREAGHLIPYRAPRRRSLALAAEPDVTLPSATAAADLRVAERGVVTALRVWVAAYKQQQDPLGAARAHFEHHFNAAGTLWGDRRAGDDAGLSLHAVLRNTTLAATRPVDVRCPACPGLSPDEARLLQAIGWLQRDLAEPAAAALGDWLPPAALRLSLGAARGLATALLAAEQSLPRRDWDLAALAAAAEPAPRPLDDDAARGIAAPTLH